MIARVACYVPPGIPISGYPCQRNCRKCNAEFTASAPNQERCPTCQAARNAANQRRATLKMQAKRAAAKLHARAKTATAGD